MTLRALLASQSAAWLATSLISGCLARTFSAPFQHAAIRPGGRLPDQYRHLPACPGAAAIDDCLRLRFADGDPIGADIGVGIVVRPHADLDDVNAGVFGALQQFRIRLDIEIMSDDDVRLFRYQRRDGLRADVGAEMRVADLEFHPEAIGLLFQRRSPSLGQIDAHRARHEGDRLAVERLEVIGASRVIHARGDGVTRDPRQRHCDPHCREDVSLFHAISSLIWRSKF